MPSINARSKPRETSTTTTTGVRLRASLLTRIGETRRDQAKALGVSEDTLYRWIGGVGRSHGAKLPSQTTDRVAELLNVPTEQAWIPAHLAPPPTTRDPRRSASARRAAQARWGRTTKQAA